MPAALVYSNLVRVLDNVVVAIPDQYSVIKRAFNSGELLVPWVPEDRLFVAALLASVSARYESVQVLPTEDNVAVKAQKVVVAAAPTRLDVASDADFISGQHCMIRNKDASASIFIGGSTVTATTGFEVFAGEALSLDLVAQDALYGITASGNVNCDVIQAGV